MSTFKKIVLLMMTGLAVIAISCSSDDEEDVKKDEPKDKIIPITKKTLTPDIDIDGDGVPDLAYDGSTVSAAGTSLIAPLSAFVDRTTADMAVALTMTDEVSEKQLKSVLPTIDSFRNIGQTNPEAFTAGSIVLETDKTFVVLIGTRCFVVAINGETVGYLEPFATP